MENLLFLQKVLEFKELFHSKSLNLKKKALEIYNLFLKPDEALYELNCSKKEIAKVKRIIDQSEVDLTIFDPIFKEVEKNLGDSLIRFLSSEDYYNYQKIQKPIRSNSIVKGSSKPEVVFSPELVEDFTHKKCFSVDEGISKRISWKNMLQKLKDVYISGQNITSSPELSSISEKKLLVGFNEVKKNSDDTDEDWELNDDSDQEVTNI